MVVVNPEKLIKLQRTPDRVRNICVLAHVDHGKTSLTDSLIATNGIISPKMAGKIRYLDSRPDEQIRGITMESSAISLFFSLLRKPSPDATPEQHDYLINLIDSPGHVDFSSEVSTASRLCDGAIILVDAVEGVCSQTVAVLRQTWIEHLTPILVINKMDRLITELRMTPGEANAHLNKLLEQVNAVVGGFFQGERMEDDLRWRERMENQTLSSSHPENTHAVESNGDSITQESLETGRAFEEKDDEDIYFEPAKGNVIFSSATDGWAFTVKQFAGFYEKKLGIKREILENVLWGDFYLDPKTKRILAPKHLKGRVLKPMFVQLVLDNIWAVYDAAVGGDKGRGDAEKVEKIAKSLSLNLPVHVLRSRDPRAILTALLSAWVPLSTAMLVSVIEHLPSPEAAQTKRMPGLLDSSPGSSHISDNVKQAVVGLKSSRSDPLVAFVSKMVSIPEKDLPENKTRTGQSLTADEARELGRKKRAEIARAQAAANGERPDVAELREALSNTGISEASSELSKDEDQEEVAPEAPERLIGFARLFSGTLEVGDEIYVLHPKFNPANPHASPEPQKVTITALYLLMGRGLEPLTSVPAGVVFGVAGLEGHLMKSGTLCSQLEGSVNLAGLSMGTQPIVRVALEPENPADLDKMVAGLRLLEQSDPCAAYEVLESGEHVILTAGELHLERCLKDLRERFARCEIQAGAPIVPYREGIVSAAEMNPPHDKNLPRGTVIGVVASKQVTIRLRVRPLPGNVTDFLLENASSIRQLYADQIAEEHQNSSDADDANDLDRAPSSQPTFVGDGHENLGSDTRSSVRRIKDGLEHAFANVEGNRDPWRQMASKVVAFGPRRTGPNILIDATQSQHCQQISLGTMLHEESIKDQAAPSSTAHASTAPTTTPDISDKITYAFQLAASHGPLCQEPLQGVAVILEEITFTPPPTAPTATQPDDNSDNTPAPAAPSDLGRLGGEVIRTTRDAIRQGFLDWSPRLLLAMYSCEIQASTEVLGRVYGVVTRRRGRIMSESMNEGTPFFTIVAEIPVAESFGFSDEIRKRTSGAASPQLIFRGYQMLDEDPFWVPFTEEELEDLGELADKENLAKKYMDGVRRRKGLFVAGKKLVESAEKQKTLKR